MLYDDDITNQDNSSITYRKAYVQLGKHKCIALGVHVRDICLLVYIFESSLLMTLLSTRSLPPKSNSTDLSEASASTTTLYSDWLKETPSVKYMEKEITLALARDSFTYVHSYTCSVGNISGVEGLYVKIFRVVVSLAC